MNNIEFLKSAGFFERDGWLCNPNLNGEAIFKLGDPNYGVENKSISWIFSVISTTSFNAGVRHQEQESKKEMINKLQDFIQKINNS